ncbi:MAG: hypothetical protein WBE13_14655 [Candidatus Acidiferrum sp.]
MNPALLFVAAFVVLLLVLLGFALRGPRKQERPVADGDFSEAPLRRHVTYFPQLRQAIAEEDLVFLSSRGFRRLTRKVREERRKIALAYLSCLRSDFLRLWQLARVIAALSPQVGMGQEFERFRLGLIFSVRYELVRVKFLIGFAPLPDLGSLCEAVSRLAVRLEIAMNLLGERAALATKLTSTLDGRGFNTP